MLVKAKNEGQICAETTHSGPASVKNVMQTDLFLPVLNAPEVARPLAPLEAAAPRTHGAKLWLPQRVLFTPDALQEAYGQQILARAQALNLPIELLKSNRLTGLRGADERATYRTAKTTLAVVNAPAGALRLQPTPPSADFQLNLAEGCPAHCQYCYLAGSLSGPPVVRAFANLPRLLENTQAYERADRPVSFEASCYTDPLAIEHLTGGLATAIEHFGTHAWSGPAQLRATTKFDDVGPLLDLPHHGRTRLRFSVNAATVARRFEGATSPVPARIAALGRVAEAGYPVGLTVAPIMPVGDWRTEYGELFDAVAAVLPRGADLTVECITHRFTPNSKATLTDWYPRTKLEMDEDLRTQKRGKFGAVKHVYPKDVMAELRTWFTDAVDARLPGARFLYWT